MSKSDSSPIATTSAMSTAPSDAQDRHSVGRRRRERRTGDGPAECALKIPPPSSSPWRRAPDPSIGDVPRHHEVSAHESAAGSSEATEHGDADGKWRIRDDVKWTAGQPEVLPISANDGHVVIDESLSQLLCSSRVQFERDDSRAPVHQSTRQYAGTSPDI